ncbi:4'-phosphopantetheinyl transferase superfamily protein [Nonomuraea sp. NPDC050310]|uniref:4'-phosphopantetheinyl transferase family protein n=1 Tax=Nonomuraea sp. NPDC050310 TaxID=3154935 RepID=UPI0033D3EEB6
MLSPRPADSVLPPRQAGSVLPPRTVEVWRAPAGPAGGLALLSADELARHGRFRRAEDRDRFARAWTLVRLVLGELLGRDPAALAFDRTCRLCGGPHGKPRLTGPEGPRLDFSLSHSGGEVIAAFCSGAEVGVDIEQVGRRLDVRTVAPTVLSETELSELTRLGWGAGDFLTWWTRKEAVLKATGHGLAVELAAVEVSGPYEDPQVRGLPPELGDPADYTLHALDVGPTARAALAVRGPLSTVTVHDGSTLLIPG